MARPLRIEFENTAYPVMSRGEGVIRRSEAIADHVSMSRSRLKAELAIT